MKAIGAAADEILVVGHVAMRLRNVLTFGADEHLVSTEPNEFSHPTMVMVLFGQKSKHSDCQANHLVSPLVIATHDFPGSEMKSK